MTTDRERLVTIDAEEIYCPAPIPEDQRVILGHGSGGQLSAALMRDLIAPALASAAPGGVLNDAAVLEIGRFSDPPNSSDLDPLTTNRDDFDTQFVARNTGIRIERHFAEVSAEVRPANTDAMNTN